MLDRDNELDKLFNRMYEDNVAGKIDDTRFAKMFTQRYLYSLMKFTTLFKTKV